MKTTSLINDLFYSILKLVNSNEKTIIVTVAGLSRSGKSTLIDKIEKKLNEKSICSTIIKLDNWIVPASMRNDQMTVRERYQYEKINNDITKLIKKKTINICPYDSVSRELLDKEVKVTIEGSNVVFIDGVIALDHGFLNGISNLKVFVEIKEYTRKKRFQEFYRLKGFNAQEIKKTYNQRMIDELRIVRNSKQNADILIQLKEKK